MTSDEARIAKIAEARVQFNRLAIRVRERNSLVETLDQVDDIIRRDPAEGWMFIQAVRQMDLDTSLLSNLAAGPLEDFLIAHGETEIARVEHLAERDTAFRYLLGLIWKNAMPDRRLAAGPTYGPPSLERAYRDCARRCSGMRLIACGCANFRITHDGLESVAKEECGSPRCALDSTVM
ncbi:hypothetical protein FJU31_05130 [Stenotrophomonas cyclobalanopsidis]|uniref:DUF6869 domain-containing protein n=1 Tax=Stenotrophomonas cyclobalanopsidis TaxID=2771362 RepID=A0ABQ6T3X6_9GAMM|nr:hypothetical protein [Stenotrophomonas cyclobalanopsidis]KAA9002259.1 hypothetical protein FJU31_05130 [Stenotrophomonas cyclobalanopsidis]